MDLSIIVINYNTNQLTKNCIQSIIDTTEDVEYEIIVIDNHSTKENPEEIAMAFPIIKLIINNENIGFGQANNQGLKYAKGNYVLFLNSDTIVLEGCLDRAIKFLWHKEATDKIGLLGCNVLNPDFTNQKSTFKKGNPLKYFLTSNPIFGKFIKSEDTFDYNREQFVTGVSGCFMLFPKSVFDKILPFDPDFFMYSEETDLCRNRLNKYFNCIYYPRSKIIHLVRGGKVNYINVQEWLSYALYRYKLGLGSYLLYLLASLLNVASILLLIPIVIWKSQSHNAEVLKVYFRLLPYWFWHIPRYPKKWGARPQPLRIK